MHKSTVVSLGKQCIASKVHTYLTYLLHLSIGKASQHERKKERGGYGKCTYVRYQHNHTQCIFYLSWVSYHIENNNNNNSQTSTKRYSIEETTRPAGQSSYLYIDLSHLSLSLCLSIYLSARKGGAVQLWQCKINNIYLSVLWSSLILSTQNYPSIFF